ncbi:MAG: class I SAM-dependent methyltransferase [Candidatus Acidiferrales bacterium]
MSLLSKLRVAYDRQVAHGDVGRAGSAAAAAEDRASPALAPRGGRLSNSLKDFLWHLDGVGHGSLLDLGPVWQATVSFFIERGFKVYTEDLLSAWKAYLHAEEERLRASPPGEDTEKISPAARAESFLRQNLQYPGETFDAVLVWDMLDYLEGELVTRVVARLAELLKEGGVALTVFHSRKPEAFHRYRVIDAQNLELIPAPTLFPVQRIYQNREILNLFSRFHSSKTFVGRDQLREGLFIK